MSSWNEVINFIKDVSPILSTAISSVNPAAGIFLSLISKEFGANKDDPDDVLNKIKCDPEYKIKLKKIEYEHEESLTNLNSQDYNTEVNDRESARDLQIKYHSFIPTFLAVGYFIFYAIVNLYCLIHPAQINDVICARLNDGFMLVLSYFFGSKHKQVT